MSGIVGGAGSKSGVIGTTELDYEEGAWTPAHGTFTLGGATQGRYIKQGKQVTVWGYLVFDSDTNDNSAAFSGLPFTSSGNAFYASSGSCNSDRIDLYSDYDYICPRVNTSGTTWTFYCCDAGTGGWNDHISSDTNSHMYFMIIYESA